MQDLPPKAHHYFIPKSLMKKNYLGSIIKIPPAPQEDIAYTDLALSDDDRLNIAELITTMSESNKFQLLFKQSHLKTIGAEINHVHPLKFLAAVFTHPELKLLMPNIRSDHFKWTRLVDGLGSNLTREGIKGKLELYLNDFSQEVGISPDEIRPFFEARNWEDFVFFLMNHG